MCEVMVFGDNDNDVEMLCLVGLGVVMGNVSVWVKVYVDSVIGWYNMLVIVDFLVILFFY